MKYLTVIIVLLICGDTLYAQDLTVSEKMVERFTGPFHFRFILQPLMAIIFGIKDGRVDAIQNKTPYILNIILGKERRSDSIKHGLRSIAKVLAIGIVLDALVQIYLFHGLFFLGALLVGAVVIALPYALARGISNRLSKPLHS